MRRKKLTASLLAIVLSSLIGMSAASAAPGGNGGGNGGGGNTGGGAGGSGGSNGGGSDGENNGCGAPSAEEGGGNGGLLNGKDCDGDDEVVPVVVPDTTPPVITSWAFSGTAGTSPWFTSGGDVTVVCTDDVDGVFAGSADPSSLSGDGIHTVALTCTDLAGNTATGTATVKIDSTLPTITWSGTRIYDVDEMLAVSCAAADATSGVATTTCPASVSDNAYLHIGSNPVSASATDNAGNSLTSATSYQVIPTVAGSCRLISQFVSNAGVANSLCVKLRNSQASAARGQATAELNVLSAFDKEVSAQSGKHIVAGAAPILLNISNYFRTN